MLLLKTKVPNNIVDAFKDVLRAGVRPSNMPVIFDKMREIRDLIPDTVIYATNETVFEIGVLSSIRDNHSVCEIERYKNQLEAFFEGIVIGLMARKFSESDDTEDRFTRIAVA